MLRQLLKRCDETRADIAAIDAQIAERVETRRDDIDRLKTVPGIDDVAAPAIVAEMGTDMSVFDTSKKLTAWAGPAPGSHRSVPSLFARRERWWRGGLVRRGYARRRRSRGPGRS